MGAEHVSLRSLPITSSVHYLGALSHETDQSRDHAARRRPPCHNDCNESDNFRVLQLRRRGKVFRV